MQAILDKLTQKVELSQKEISSVFSSIMAGKASDDFICEFLLKLNQKGPSVSEITSSARILRDNFLKVPAKKKLILDTCGTGGDKKDSFNISTVSAIVAAACGLTVAKHGNRSVSSHCGSADILEGLGMNLDLTPDEIGRCLDKVGLAFLFAQKLHPAMKNVASARKKLGVKTIFNILGPLINPAGATHQVMGVYDKALVEPLAYVLKNLGAERALVVHGSDGLDEITLTGETYASEWNGKEIKHFKINPVDLGFTLCREEDLKGGDLAANIKITQNILDGKKGAARDVVVLNAAYALYIAQGEPLVEPCIRKCEEAIDSRKAQKKLDELIQFTQGKL